MKPEAAFTLEPDGTVTERRPHRWEQTLAAWSRCTHAAMLEGDGVLDHAKEHALVTLDRIVAENIAYPIGPVELMVADQHADLFTRRDVVVLAEVRALILKHPNPFPELELFPRLERLRRRLRR